MLNGSFARGVRAYGNIWNWEIYSNRPIYGVLFLLVGTPHYQHHTSSVLLNVRKSNPFHYINYLEVWVLWPSYVIEPERVYFTQCLTDGGNRQKVSITSPVSDFQSLTCGGNRQKASITSPVSDFESLTCGGNRQKASIPTFSRVRDHQCLRDDLKRQMSSTCAYFNYKRPSLSRQWPQLS